MIKRFVSVTQACLCSIMSTKRVVADLQEIILLYMDAMVEIDGLLLNPNWMQDNQEFNNNDNDDHHMDYMTGNSEEQITNSIRKKRSSNFVKSNSLGLLVAANTHSYQGPATLNWEGGWHGEHKIQPVMPLPQIKRSNVDWQTIILRQLYQHETIQGLLDDCMKQEQNENQTSRQMEGAVKLYGSRQMAEEAHSYQGPATLNWEGGWHGEHKIQPVMPLPQIKRSNVDWQTIILRQLYQHETIQGLLDDCMKQEQNENQTSRQMEGAVKLYGSRQMAEEAIYLAQLMTAVLDHKNVLYIPYRPIGRANTPRSSVNLMEIKCDDNECTVIQNLYWVCPIQPTNNITHFDSIHWIKSNFIKEFVLMLPTLNEDNGQDFISNYYCVGHTWTERNEEGNFIPTPIRKNIFREWYEYDDDENNDEYMI